MVSRTPDPVLLMAIHSISQQLISEVSLTTHPKPSLTHGMMTVECLASLLRLAHVVRMHLSPKAQPSAAKVDFFGWPSGTSHFVQLGLVGSCLFHFWLLSVSNHLKILSTSDHCASPLVMELG